MIKLTQNNDRSFSRSEADDVCTHILLTGFDFNIFMRMVDEDPLNYQIKTDSLIEKKEKTEKAIGGISEELKKSNEISTDLKAQIKDAKKQCTVNKAKNEELDESNKNLLRMAKEQSNAARDLRPKKQHTGYVVQRSDQVRLIISGGDSDEPVYGFGWKTMLETPYPSSLPLDDIEDKILQDVGDLYSDMATMVGRCDMCELTDEELSGCTIYNFDFHFNKNDKNDLWLICLYSTQQLDISPDRFANSNNDDKENLATVNDNTELEGN